MTSQNFDPPTAETARPSTTSSGTAGTTDTAKNEARGVAETAKEQAGSVAGEARSQAQQLWSQTRQEVQSQAGQQQTRIAGSLRSLADDVSSMAERSEPGMARDLAREVSDKASTAASWLEQRDPGSLLTEVRRFARQRPGAFLALAAGLGVVGGRMSRAMVDEHRDESNAPTPHTGIEPVRTPTTGTPLTGSPVAGGSMAPVAGAAGSVPPPLATDELAYPEPGVAPGEVDLPGTPLNPGSPR
jgi:hypothetical protein